MIIHELVGVGHEEVRPPYSVDFWTPADAPDLYGLEVQNWAPWLRMSEEGFATIAENFPEQQRLIRDGKGRVVAAIRANRIDIEWEKNPVSLPSWDDVAGGGLNIENPLGIHTSNGNTLYLMSSNVDRSMQGQGLGTMLVDAMKDAARKMGVSHLVGPFRPSDFGRYKFDQLKKDRKEDGVVPFDAFKQATDYRAFDNYCKKTRDGKPLDRWLRLLSHHNMRPLTIQNDSMKVVVSRQDFDKYKEAYNPDDWMKVEDKEEGIETWVCPEVGDWYIFEKVAAYAERNLLGELPLDATL